jgi:hypothetical protein
LHAQCFVSKLSLDGYVERAARGVARDPLRHATEFSSR